jgi:hypothetical protein
MILKYKGKKYKIIKNYDDNDLTNSYINHDRKIIYIRRKLDLIHEVLHLILKELNINHDIDEFVTTFISENLENLILENLENPILEYILIV